MRSNYSQSIDKVGRPRDTEPKSQAKVRIQSQVVSSLSDTHTALSVSTMIQSSQHVNTEMNQVNEPPYLSMGLGGGGSSSGSWQRFDFLVTCL